MFVLPMFTEEAWKVPEEGNRTMLITLEKHGSTPWGNACGNTNCQLSPLLLLTQQVEVDAFMHILVYSQGCGAGQDSKG